MLFMRIELMEKIEQSSIFSMSSSDNKRCLLSEEPHGFFFTSETANKRNSKAVSFVCC
jgi:hypothetical protein